jgi:hypothetical protein
MGSFSGSGEFALGHRDITVTVTGTFKSATRLTGTVVGPKVCGGSDRYTAIPGAQ